MTRATRYPPELREHRAEHPSESVAIQSVAGKLGMTAETLRKWLRREEIDRYERPGVTSSKRERIREPEWENRELQRGAPILTWKHEQRPGNGTANQGVQILDSFL